MRPVWHLVLSASLLWIAACTPRKSRPAASETEPAVVYTPNGWSNAERAEYHHLPEGSELVPYGVLANVVSTRTGKPFLQQMERFGFVADPAGPGNPRGLPVGLTVARSRNASTGGLEMVGFNCAACHVGEIAYRGRRLRIDGAPSLVNLQAYQIEFKDSLEATLKSPEKLLALVIALDREQPAPDTPAAAAASPYAQDPSLKTAADVTEAPTADPQFHSMPSRAADALAPDARTKPGFAERMKNDVALLKARLAYLKNGRLLVDGTEPGPGRVDAFGAARNLLFPDFAMKMLSPVSFPYIWGVPDTAQQRSAGQEMRWIHYDGNTNSILERNIGQALGMGAVFDPKTFESTLRIENLHRLEVLTHKLQPPAWPRDLLGPIDEGKAKAGEQIFNQQCRDCHQDRLSTLMDVGTDPNRASSFGQPVGGKPFPAAVAPILSGLKKRAFQDDGISEADQAGMDANPAVWRATGQYMARPLQGIWATAPYLHNGSVPTLYHLLYPEERPAKFAVGGREYDPVKIGYASDLAADGGRNWIYDTTKPGNANIGHSGARYGAHLSAAQKSALLEYLKTL